MTERQGTKEVLLDKFRKVINLEKNDSILIKIVKYTRKWSGKSFRPEWTQSGRNVTRKNHGKT